MNRELTDAIRSVLEDEVGWSSYDCSRVWSAWNVGTMDERDFTPVSERIEDIIKNVVDSVVLVLGDKIQLEKQMIETWQQKWSKASGYDTRDGCMLSEIEELRRANTRLLDMLKWYVEEDDVIVGQEGNEYWEEGFFKAQTLIEELQ